MEGVELTKVKYTHSGIRDTSLNNDFNNERQDCKSVCVGGAT
jgi:hypothetical protein